MPRYPADRVHRKLKDMVWYNFLGGIAWGLGVTIGLSILLALLGFIISKIDLIPGVGDIVKSLENINIQKPNPVLQ